MTLDLDDIIAKARAVREATKTGQWFARETTSARHSERRYPVHRHFVTAVPPDHPAWHDDMRGYINLGVWADFGLTTAAIAAHIASACPDTIIALVERLQAAERERDVARDIAVADSATGTPEERRAAWDRAMAAYLKVCDERDAALKSAEAAWEVARARCPSCDAPLATAADLRSDDTPRPEDDPLCWRAFHGDECQREPVDWRDRALAAEQERDAAMEFLELHTDRRREAHTAYEDSASVLEQVAAERNRLADRLRIAMNGWKVAEEAQHRLERDLRDRSAECEASRWAVVALAARLETIDAEHTACVDQLLEVAARVDIERGMARAHQKNAMRFADGCAELRADVVARDRALDACAERIREILDLRALISDEKAVAGEAGNAQSGTEGGE